MSFYRWGNWVSKRLPALSKFISQHNTRRLSEWLATQASLPIVPILLPGSFSDNREPWITTSQNVTSRTATNASIIRECHGSLNSCVHVFFFCIGSHVYKSVYAGAFVYMVWYTMCSCLYLYAGACMGMCMCGRCQRIFWMSFLKNCPSEVSIPLSYPRQVEILWDEPLEHPGRWMHRGFVESLFWLLKQSGLGMRTQGPILMTPCLELNSTGRLERYQLEQKLAGVAEEAHLWGKQGWKTSCQKRTPPTHI